MKTIMKTGAAVLAMCAMMGQSWAAGVCARPREAMALKTAAMQQQLMVAALYCSDVSLYNRFVVSFQRELQDSDAALLSYFKRVNGRSGETKYHAYKTGLANTFSLNGLHGMQAYCAAAQTAFDAALNTGQQTLATFISSQSVTGTEDYATCSGTETAASDKAVTTASSRTRTRVASTKRN